MVRHIWDDDTNSFLSARQLYIITKSPKIGIARPELIRACSEAWDLTGRTLPSPGTWYTEDGAPDVNPQEFFHLKSITGSQRLARVYKQDRSSLRLLPVQDRPQALICARITEARIIHKSPSGKVLGYNPEDPADDDILFPFGNGRVTDLGFDPLDWSWKKMGAMKKVHTSLQIQRREGTG